MHVDEVARIPGAGAVVIVVLGCLGLLLAIAVSAVSLWQKITGRGAADKGVSLRLDALELRCQRLENVRAVADDTGSFPNVHARARMAAKVAALEEHVAALLARCEQRHKE